MTLIRNEPKLLIFILIILTFNLLITYLSETIFSNRVNITKNFKELNRKMDRMFPTNPNPMTEPFSTVNRNMELKEG